jgi:hypothetical protein
LLQTACSSIQLQIMICCENMEKAQPKSLYQSWVFIRVETDQYLVYLSKILTCKTQNSLWFSVPWQDKCRANSEFVKSTYMQDFCNCRAQEPTEIA